MIIQKYSFLYYVQRIAYLWVIINQHSINFFIYWIVLKKQKETFVFSIVSQYIEMVQVVKAFLWKDKGMLARK